MSSTILSRLLYRYGIVYLILCTTFLCWLSATEVAANRHDGEDSSVTERGPSERLPEQTPNGIRQQPVPHATRGPGLPRIVESAVIPTNRTIETTQPERDPHRIASSEDEVSGLPHFATTTPRISPCHYSRHRQLPRCYFNINRTERPPGPVPGSSICHTAVAVR